MCMIRWLENIFCELYILFDLWWFGSIFVKFGVDFVLGKIVFFKGDL